MYLQSLLVWERPLQSGLMLLGLSGLFWLFSSTSLRPIFLISLSVLAIAFLDHWKSELLPYVVVQHPMDEGESDGNSTRPRLLKLPELCHYLAESCVAFNLYLKEVLEYKRQNPGKLPRPRDNIFHFHPPRILQIHLHSNPSGRLAWEVSQKRTNLMSFGSPKAGNLILSLLLWPLVVYHELIQKMYTGLEPVLMKLDYSMKGGTQHRQRDRKKKTMVKTESCDEPTAETESESEAELSCFNSKVDVRTTALAFAITDSELSDEEASILESGGFTMSRGTTPQLSDVSEDLDQQSMHSEPEEAFAKDLPEFPSVEDLAGDGSPSHVLPGLPPEPSISSLDSQFFIQTLSSPLHFVNTHFNGNEATMNISKTGPVSTLSLNLEAFSEEIVNSTITTVVQNTLSALLSNSMAGTHSESSEFLPIESQQNLSRAGSMELELKGAESHEEVDDFELLDQGELDQMDKELGLNEQLRQADSGQSTLQVTEAELLRES
ncbi:reticulophagy regulator 2 isoform X1 [Carcharodon carcharias]|uniref:reticulophagy regulator 2 isoform X1 n=1 Tax=Carcharodon carcharias TaxID=13397 RepID=UPI001B7E8B1D|nr:reticulophagy regulator 2 isoform X1 [Carcharodon carcharias]